VLPTPEHGVIERLIRREKGGRIGGTDREREHGEQSCDTASNGRHDWFRTRCVKRQEAFPGVRAVDSRALCGGSVSSAVRTKVTIELWIDLSILFLVFRSREREYGTDCNGI
jgi:hypothetical protein